MKRPPPIPLAAAALALAAGAATAKVGFPYFGGLESPHFANSVHGDVLVRTVPVQRVATSSTSRTAFGLVRWSNPEHPHHPKHPFTARRRCRTRTP